ncbi:uncharacterized protein VICG_01679, partial [Vittaforma corneae ATCC 50505]
VPSGKSTGGKEACVIVDNQSSYFGQSVWSIVEKINGDANMLLDISIDNPSDLDDYLIAADGTEDKSRLGANYTLPLSICCYKLFSHCLSLKLWRYIQCLTESKYTIPTPYFNILNGGVHSGNNISCQEIMVAFQESSFEKNLERAVELYYSLRDVIIEEFGLIFTSVGDEGGFAPPIKNLEEGLNLILKSAKKASITNFRIGLDLAANSFYSEVCMWLMVKVLMENLWPICIIDSLKTIQLPVLRILLQRPILTVGGICTDWLVIKSPSLLMI